LVFQNKAKKVMRNEKKLEYIFPSFTSPSSKQNSCFYFEKQSETKQALLYVPLF